MPSTLSLYIKSDLFLLLETGGEASLDAEAGACALAVERRWQDGEADRESSAIFRSVGLEEGGEGGGGGGEGGGGAGERGGEQEERERVGEGGGEGGGGEEESWVEEEEEVEHCPTLFNTSTTPSFVIILPLLAFLDRIPFSLRRGRTVAGMSSNGNRKLRRRVDGAIENFCLTSAGKKTLRHPDFCRCGACILLNLPPPIQSLQR